MELLRLVHVDFRMALSRSVVPPLAPNQYLGQTFQLRFIR